MKIIQCALIAIALASAAPAWSQVASRGEEHAKLLQSARTIDPLGSELFGDSINLYNGSTEFRHVDVSVPSHAGPDVSLTRRFVMEDRKAARSQFAFADWDIDLPYLSAVGPAAEQGHWRVASNQPEARCSSPASYEEAKQQQFGSFTYVDFAQGYHLNGTDGAAQMLYFPNGPVTSQPASGGPYPWGTKTFWLFSCLPSLVSGGVGEGFLGRSPDGSSYWFDVLVTRNALDVVKPSPVDPILTQIQLLRAEVRLYPSKIVDRFGNWVAYDWVAGNLTQIRASDGRQITLTYGQNNKVASVSDGSRVWQYAYSADNTSLTRVTRPDGSTWQIDFSRIAGVGIVFDETPESCGPDCSEPVHDKSLDCSWMRLLINQEATGSIVSPSGAVGEFKFKPTRSGRTGVFADCRIADINPVIPDRPRSSDYNFYPVFSDNWALISKTITGPGLIGQTWSMVYPIAIGTYTGNTTEPKKVSAIAPDGSRKEYIFGTTFNVNDNQLLSVRSFSASGVEMSRVDTAFSSENEALLAPYPDRVGLSSQPRSDTFGAETLRPEKARITTQQGAVFTWHVPEPVSQFDVFARPLRVSRFSASLASNPSSFSTAETTSYYDDPALWVLGQVASVTDGATGKKISETSYDARALPIERRAFGLLKQTLTYNLDGTVATVGDGNGRITTVGGWKRGIPQLITFPGTEPLASRQRSATVDDLGQITSTTDELGTTTSYSYDAMGRLASLSIPGWAPSSFSFVPVASPEFGLPAGHWRHTETTGSYKKTTYFDGRFRPLLSLEEDTANAATRRYTTRAFDHDNRETFASYPEASATSVTGLSQGTHTTYDALGRVTSVSQNDGPTTFLTTSTEYLAGFQTRTTNPNGNITTVSFQAYDSPDTSAPISILGPDGIATTITRDGFGMPLSVTRSGLYAGLPVSATRNYVYDAFERLCKRIDPEAGGTLFEYDGVGNLIGSAEGQSSSLSCDAIPAAARISRSYDARDRLLSVAAPNAPVTLYGYAADGALTTLTQGESVWDYSYNNRRLLTNETLSFGDTYAFTYSYNTLGHLITSSTPGGLSIDTAPNALGQPTKAGAFASGVQYFPDGSLKQFTYGNGLIHSVTQNARHLPQQVRDALGTQVVHDFTYSYDGNGNVTNIADNDQTGLQSKSLLYDARDRLVSATATQLWGTASYAYDPLDNLRVADQGSRQFRYQYDSNNRLTQLTDPVGTLITDFAYDAQGRQIRKGTQTRTFDGANRITAINGETYAYDGSGRRIATWAADGRTKVEVYTQDGKLGFAVDSKKGGGSSFVYLAGQRIAEDHWNCGTNTHTATYYHSDALGSPVATTDADRNVLERTYYAPYGEALNRSVDGPGYTGHVMDAATGLVYAQQRYYDPVVGGFLSIDPVAADPSSGGNFNRYKYASNNPYKFTDPDGRQDCLSCERGFRASVGFMLRDRPDDLATFTSGEEAATVGFPGVEGDVAVGQVAGEFVDAGDFSGKAVAGAATKAVVGAITRGKRGPNSRMQANIKRFKDKLPANAKDSVTARDLPNDGVAVQGTSPGKVPGSAAIYEKQIDSDGNTVQFTKTTVGPGGELIGVKDKLTGETLGHE